MSKTLNEILADTGAKERRMTAEQRKEQKIDFAWGNLPEEDRATLQDMRKTYEDMQTNRPFRTNR